MIAIELTDIKTFMNKLLKTDTFDNFLLQEAVISSGASYVIDGHINKGFYTEEDLEELGISEYKILPFSMLRNNCFDLIKGKKTPSSFRFVFTLSPSNLRNTLAASGSSFTENDITGIFLNLKYQNQLLVLTTGVSYNIFSPDKSLEMYWDNAIQKFLKQHEIAFDEL